MLADIVLPFGAQDKAARCRRQAERLIKVADFLLTLMLILLTSAASLGNSLPSQTPRFSRLQSDEASYRVFLLAVTLLLKAEFTSLGVAASSQVR